MPVESEFLDEIKRLVMDKAGVLSDPADFQSAMNRALERYSKDRPLWKVVDKVGDGTGDFLVSAITGYDRYFAGEPRIEYPIVTDGEPVPLARVDWNFYRKPLPTGDVIRLLGSRPSASESVRFTFKAKHVIHVSTAASTTIYPNDFYAFCKLAASESLGDLSRKYAESKETTFLTADMTQYISKSREYEQRQKKLESEYLSHIKMGKNQVYEIQVAARDRFGHSYAETLPGEYEY